MLKYLLSLLKLTCDYTCDRDHTQNVNTAVKMTLFWLPLRQCKHAGQIDRNLFTCHVNMVVGCSMTVNWFL